MYASDIAVLSDFPRLLCRALAPTAMLLAAACRSSTGPSSVIPLDSEFELAAGHVATVGTSGLRIRFVSVPVDSRCPIGMLCIVAGDAQVQIDAEQRDVGATLKLNTSGLDRQAIFLSYSIQLVGLTPLPRAGQPTLPSSYRGTFKVSLLGPD
jgi:hypothetical protein